MEALPPHSSASTTVHPINSAFPPDGLVRVAPQTPQEITEVAREKMVVSLLQSLQATFRKFFAIVVNSLVD
jgi:hypothetical protein